MEKPRVIISVETEEPTDAWSIGEAVLSLFDAEDRLRPEKLYQWEDEVGDFTNVPDAKKFWSQQMQMSVAGSSTSVFAGLRWKRTRVLRYDAEIKHTTQNNRGALIRGNFRLTAHPHKSIDWKSMLCGLVTALHGSYAFAHVFDMKNVETGRESDHVMALFSGVSNSGKYPSLPLAFYTRETCESPNPEFKSSCKVEAVAGGFVYVSNRDWPTIFSDSSIVDEFDGFNPDHLPAEFFEARPEG